MTKTMNMKKGDKVGIVCCSNAIDIRNKSKIEELKDVFEKLGLIPIFSDFIYDRGFGFSGNDRERAEALMGFYKNDEIKTIFDISGGDIGNGVLPYLDFDLIKSTKKMFWGYSDLTTVMNAIYSKTGNSSVLYQVRNLVNEEGTMQMKRFKNSVIDGMDDLYDINYEFIQGSKMSGILVGGNIRCLLKLAGTPYWPDMNGKILLLEARSGKLAQMVTFLNQLKQMGVFEQVSGVILGTFTEMEQNPDMPHVKDIIGEYVGRNIPVAYTKEIGHGVDSKGLVIGKMIEL